MEHLVCAISTNKSTLLLRNKSLRTLARVDDDRTVLPSSKAGLCRSIVKFYHLFRAATMQLLSMYCISHLFLLLLCCPSFTFGQQPRIIFAMLGDSTTANETGYGGCLKYEFKGATILNFGASGSTTRSFFYENLPWAIKSIGKYRQVYPHHKIVCSQAFGHNDQGHSNQNTDALKAEKVDSGLFSRYSAAIHRGLEEVCDEAVFTTPIERRIYQANGQFKPTLQLYADATIRAARWTDSKVIDLHASSVKLLKGLPADIAKKDFNRKVPASQKEDDTHLDEQGCKTFAKLWAKLYTRSP